jgi:hypothetical protein
MARVHVTLRFTPAMEARVADHTWTVEELVKLMEPKSTSDGLKVIASEHCHRVERRQ